MILVNLTCRRNPWRFASSEDASYRAFTHNPGFLREILPISEELNDILGRIFTRDPLHRITLPELRRAIQDCQRFTKYDCPVSPASDVSDDSDVEVECDLDDAVSSRCSSLDGIELEDRPDMEAPVVKPIQLPPAAPIPFLFNQPVMGDYPQAQCQHQFGPTLSPPRTPPMGPTTMPGQGPCGGPYEHLFGPLPSIMNFFKHAVHQPQQFHYFSPHPVPFQLVPGF